MTIKTVEERASEFIEYRNDGYNGGKEGLRCCDCDCKYRGTAAIRQLCPVCRVKETLTADRTALIEAGVRKLKEMKVCTSAEEHERRRDHATKSGYETALDDAITALQELNSPTERAVTK